MGGEREGGGDSCMRKYDVISCVQVCHLLIAHLNSFHLLCEMKWGYKLHIHSFHTKDERN